VVTGAFGYIGRSIAERLMAEGRAVRTLTGHPDRRNPFGSRVSVAPYRFDDPSQMADSLRGAATLYNTYWIRFPRREMDFDRAVQNTRTLVEAAREAKVRRIVHISITKPDLDSPFPYFQGKARAERTVAESGLPHAIVRPTVVFGRGDILINNIAWMLRRFPVFAIPGNGRYRVRPVHVDDVAELAVRAGRTGGDEGGGRAARGEVVDAVGPETFTFEDMVRTIARAVGSRASIVRVPASAALMAASAIGTLVRDVVLTRDELLGMMAELVVTEGPATGSRRLSEWLEENSDTVGRRYASELALHYR
jgi:NADH dehydrogenase